MSSLVGVALAAGAGTRLRPLTLLRPKALCPVANVALLDHALALLRAHATDVAVNANHHAGQLAAHVDDRVHLSVEQPRALGTAGALGRLRDWIAGRDVLLVNADAYLPARDGPDALAPLVEGWDHQRCRLLVVPTDGAGDFVDHGDPVRYVGACLLPWHLVATLRDAPSGLYEVLWHDELEAGRLAMVRHRGVAIDCGTPSDYLRANLHASSGRPVVGEDAVVKGRLDRSVVWPGAYVGPGEHLIECIRAGTRDAPLTVAAPLGSKTVT